MKRLSVAIITLLVTTVVWWPRHRLILYAQSLPYVATYTWVAPADGSAVSYNCYLDGTVVTNVTATTCQVSVTTLGAHIAAVTSVNPGNVPNESIQDVVPFTLKQPSPASGLKLK